MGKAEDKCSEVEFSGIYMLPISARAGEEDEDKEEEFSTEVDVKDDGKELLLLTWLCKGCPPKNEFSSETGETIGGEGRC